MPLDLKHAWTKANDCLADVDKDQSVFAVIYDAGAYYTVDPGSYVIIPFTARPGEAKPFALTLGTTSRNHINVK